MIEVNPDTACALYLVIVSLTLLLVWALRGKKRVRKEVLSFSSQSITCEFCHAAYIDDATKPFTRCPECQSLNKNLSTKK